MRKILFSAATIFRASMFLMAVICLTQVSAEVANAKGRGDQSGIWKQVSETGIQARGERHMVPEKYQVFGLNETALTSVISTAPVEGTESARQTKTILTIPGPDGELLRFRIEDSNIFSPENQALYPTWKFYQGYGIDDPTMVGRFDWTPSGFHGYVITSKGSFQIDPYQTGDRSNYIVFYKKDHGAQRSNFHCKIDELMSADKPVETPIENASPEYTHGANLRTYRLAVASTGEYTNFFSGQTGALNAVTTSVNRINQVYRKELSLNLTLVSNTNTLYNTTTETPSNYANNGSTGDLNANQTNIDSIVGSANYDFGHLFETGDGGVAQLSSVCGGSKARGLSGLPNPTGDPFDVDYVAHEMGHQLSASHSYSASNNCGAATSTRMEPGSAVTIMGYAGICDDGANVARNSIDIFHVVNTTQIVNFLAGTGASCGTTSLPNNPPVVAALTSYTIPFNTPFTLTGSATDADSDPLTYLWEQNDHGVSSPTYTGSTDDDDSTGTFRPGFRSYVPTAGQSRTFPSLTYILNNQNEAPIYFTGTSALGVVCGGTCITAEDLPSAARTMNMRMSVRDGKGGIADQGMTLTVVNTTTPFKVTAPNTGVTWAGNSNQTVTWDVSGTTGGGINAADVRILFSSDGGQTFPNVLAASTPNDGSQSVLIPSVATANARIKVEAVGNVFFDISDVNFTTTNAPVRSRADFDGDGRTDLSVFRPSSGTWYLQRSTAGFAGLNFGVTGDVPAPGDYDNDGKTDVAVYRGAANSLFYVLKSSNSTVAIQALGSNTTGDQPIVADYDADGISDFATFRPTDRTWSVIRSAGGTTNYVWGQNGDTPVVGDFDGDNKADYTVFRSPGVWLTVPTTNPVNPTVTNWGSDGDIAVPADYDNDGKEDIAVFRPSNGTWYINRSSGGMTFTAFGALGDVPVPGDYDGDGADDIGVYRNGTWYVNRSTSGILISNFGLGSDNAIPRHYQP